jgi:hypothetical protein
LSSSQKCRSRGQIDDSNKNTIGEYFWEKLHFLFGLKIAAMSITPDLHLKYYQLPTG